jgi:VPDSG-CTERM motif
MKINITTTKKLAVISTALCALMLAFSNNAAAVTNLAIHDTHELGWVNPGVPPNETEVRAWINELRVMALNSNEPFTFAGHTNQLYRSGNFTSPFAPAPGAVLATGDINTLTINLDNYSGYTYLFAKYDQQNAGSEVWYVGDLTGVITIPQFWSGHQYGLSGWILFGGGTTGVPDGGTTAMLLGAALSVIGMARRYLMS